MLEKVETDPSYLDTEIEGPAPVFERKLVPVPSSSGTPARWWGRRWLQVVQATGCVEKISRGKAYARGGNVLSHTFTPGRITARVEGSQWPPYEVRFHVDAFDELQWRRLLGAITKRPLFAARLLAGEMPTDLETVFAETGLSLLPSTGLTAWCTCASQEASCKHLAAVSYVVADSLEADPFQLFALRGRTRTQLLTALRPGGGTARAEGMLPADPRRFYGGGSLDGFEVECSLPPTAGAVLARLGAPGAWCDEAAFREVLAPAYEVIAAQAARVVGG